MLARLRKSAEEREGGFTLIELLVVIIIIGILAAIAIPVFLNQRKKAHDAASKSDLKSLATAQESYLTSNPDSYTSDLTALQNEGYKPTNGVLVAVDFDVANGYCMAAVDSSSTNIYWYDSEAGGLQTAPTTRADTTVTNVTAPSPTGGACAGQAMTVAAP